MLDCTAKAFQAEKAVQCTHHWADGQGWGPFFLQFTEIVLTSSCERQYVLMDHFPQGRWLYVFGYVSIHLLDV